MVVAEAISRSSLAFSYKFTLNLQVDFIDSLCLPAYRSLAKLTDTLQPVLDGCLDNRKEWERLAKAGTNCSGGGGGAAEEEGEGERD